MTTIPDGKIEAVRFIQGLTAERPELLRPIDHHSWAKLVAMLLWFAACILAAAWNPLIAGLPVFLLMGVLHYHMIVAIHEAIHRTLFSNNRLNDAAGVLIGGFALANFDSVKKHHLSHHQLYGRETDPDRAEYMFDPPAGSTAELIWRIFKRSFALTNLGEKIERNLWQRKTPSTAAVKPAGEFGALTVMALAQSIVFLLYWSLGIWWQYFAFWLAPMFVLSRFLSGLRMYGEHAGLALGATSRNQEQIYAARTTAASMPWWRQPSWLIEKFLLGPFNFNYHHEHHIMQQLPHHHLPRVHRALLEIGYYDRHPRARSGSYFATLREQVRATPSLRAAGSALE
ncbi:MAG TPA: fatty acid desaturase [Verrucomicrobiae bacterium]|nr:fatty acid desaturase [Verrucomicrobiae bacterium]